MATVAEVDQEQADVEHRALKFLHLRAKDADQLTWDGQFLTLPAVDELGAGPWSGRQRAWHADRAARIQPDVQDISWAPWAAKRSAAFLRPETAQGIFVNFKNVVDSTRVRVPFGIAQIGKSFRNEITPRNFTFRSREFEQMEIEFFCHPGQSQQWYRYWRDRRMKWYTDLGLAGERLRLREHEADGVESLLDRYCRHRIRVSVPARRASSGSWRGSRIAAISTSAATWKESSTPRPVPWSLRRTRRANRVGAGAART